MKQPLERCRRRRKRRALRLCTAALTLSLAPSAVLAQGAPEPPPRIRGRLQVSLAEYMECAVENAFIRGEAVLLTGGDLQPNEPVEVVLEQASGDSPMGIVRANARGGLSALVTIPASAPTDEDVRLRAVAEKGELGGGVVLRSPPLRIFADARDADGDGFQDRCDTCPALASANLEDSDADGLGDPCDECANDSDNDSDGDGLCADVDPNPYAAEPGAPTS
jgi:Thrombospondin type 3 repeat